jgi:hypothetical protein
MNKTQKDLQKIISKGKVYASTMGQLIAGLGVQLGLIPVQPKQSIAQLRDMANKLRAVADEIDGDADTLVEWLDRAIIHVEKGPITDASGKPLQ